MNRVTGLGTGSTAHGGFCSLECADGYTPTGAFQCLFGNFTTPLCIRGCPKQPVVPNGFANCSVGVAGADIGSSNPRNPRHFDIIKGGENVCKTTFRIKGVWKKCV